MKAKTNFQALIAAIVLIIAGTLSPSNGIDDRSYKTPLELITTMFIIIIISLAVYFIWTLIENYTEASKRSDQQNKESQTGISQKKLQAIIKRKNYQNFN